MSQYKISIPVTEYETLSEEDIYKRLESASSEKMGIPMKCGIRYSKDTVQVRYFMLTLDIINKLQ